MRILASITLSIPLLGFAAANVQAQNLLVVLLDDAGVDKFSVYGTQAGQDDQPPTPNIDALAAAGVRFTNATSSPICMPARASLLTGKSAMTTGLGGNSDVSLDPNETTIADALGSAGYATGLFGKWHLTGALTSVPMDHPLQLGFDQTRGTGGNLSFAGGTGYYDWVNYVDGVEQVPHETTYSSSYYVDEAIAFIQAQTGSWFAFVSFNAPHHPHETPPAGLHTYSAYAQGQTPTNDQERRDIFAAQIQAADTEIGRLLSVVNSSNTMIVFLSDNGSPSNTIHPVLDSTHSKGTAYEGGVRVPLIVSGAGVPAASQGLASDVLVEIGDVFATALAVAGITSVFSPGESQSFAYALSNPAAASLRSTAQGQRFLSAGFSGPRVLSRLSNREECFKVLQHETMPDVELYDLCNDPLEATNLNTPSITQLQEAMRDALAADLDPAAGVTDCTNGVDDDDDGTIDWDDGMNGNPDAGCLGPLDLSEHHVGLPCDDGYDNDDNGLTDFRLTPAAGDPECDDPNDPTEGIPIVTICSDGIDNDGDGLADYDPGAATHDPGCTSIADDSEKEPGLACDDGIDNDLRGDGVDYPADPGCKHPSWSTEEPACQNGIDDDGLGDGIDFDGGLSANGFADPAGADSGCRYPYRLVETHGSACGLGFEWAAFLGLPALRRRLRRPSGPTATRP